MTDKIETDYDTGWREGYEAASGNAMAAFDTNRLLQVRIERLEAITVLLCEQAVRSSPP